MRKLSVAAVVVGVLAIACGGAATGGVSATNAPVAASAAPYIAPAPVSTADTSGGYGGYGGYGDKYGYGTPAPKAAMPTGPLQLVDSAKLGKVLAASNGLTLYTNKNDTMTSSACNASCASIWPPYITTSGAPAAPAGITGTVGVVTWSDGSVQVTLNGQPLYFFSGDAKSGDATGDGADGIWSAVRQ
ncbi:MAG TPA: hypothetical protein VKR80_05475 [Candidatus Limnocylindria bacterium]|nr:hypothetical protein [Candidatus Limnocylindria bacterium]